MPAGRRKIPLPFFDRAPIEGLTDDERRFLHEEHFDRTSRTLHAVSLVTIPIYGLYVSFLWMALPHRSLLIWWVVASLTALLGQLAALRHRRARARGADMAGVIRLEYFTISTSAVMMGSLTWLGTPDEQTFKVFVIGGIASGILSGAFINPSARLFDAFVVSSITSALLGMAYHGHPYTFPALVAAPFIWVLGATAHTAVNRVQDENSVLRRRMIGTNDALTVANARLAELATQDPLTGLANRSKLLDHLDRLLVRLHGSSSRLAVLFVDLDRFKVVNDSLGHAAGDELLRTIASRADSLLGSGSVLSRLGGDEFTFVLHPFTSETAAVSMAERLLREISEPVDLDGRKIVVTASIGIALSTDVDSAEDLLRHADTALYKAKGNGRNRVEFFDEALRASLLSRIDEAQRLREALASGGIVPWYQPEVSLADGLTVGANALARYEHPERGTLEAADFLELIHETGLLDELNEATFTRTIAQRADWHRRGIAESVAVRIHVPHHALAVENFPARVAERIERFGCPPSGLMIEVEESALIADPRSAATRLAAIRDLGVRTGINDFGSSHAALSSLVDLPLDGVRIDSSLIRRLPRDHRASMVVQGAVDIANRLGLETCADGIETPEQAQLLCHMGCNSALGFLWSPALPAEKMIDRFHAGSAEHLDSQACNE